MPRQRIQRERQILETLDAHDGKWVFIVADSYSASKASSIRRAARRLKEKGIIDIEHRVSRREGKAPRRRLAAKRHQEPVLPHDLDVMLPSPCSLYATLSLQARSGVGTLTAFATACRRISGSSAWRWAVISTKSSIAYPFHSKRSETLNERGNPSIIWILP